MIIIKEYTTKSSISQWTYHDLNERLKRKKPLRENGNRQTYEDNNCSAKLLLLTRKWTRKHTVDSVVTIFRIVIIRRKRTIVDNEEVEKGKYTAAVAAYISLFVWRKLFQKPTLPNRNSRYIIVLEFYTIRIYVK